MAGCRGICVFLCVDDLEHIGVNARTLVTIQDLLGTCSYHAVCVCVRARGQPAELRLIR